MTITYIVEPQDDIWEALGETLRLCAKCGYRLLCVYRECESCVVVVEG